MESKKINIPKVWLKIKAFFGWLKYKIHPTTIEPLDDKYKLSPYLLRPGLPWGKMKDNQYWKYDDKTKDGVVIPEKNWYDGYEYCESMGERHFLFATYYNEEHRKWINGSGRTDSGMSYGVYEFDVIIPIVDGLNPAIWIFFETKNDYAEIDLLETFNKKIQSNVHFGTPVKRYQLPFRMKIKPGRYKMTLLYMPDYVEFYLDYKMYYRVDFKDAMPRNENGILIINNCAYQPEKLDDNIYTFQVFSIKYKPYEL